MQFIIVGLQRKRLLESLKFKGVFFFPEEKEDTLSSVENKWKTDLEDSWT